MTVNALLWHQPIIGALALIWYIVFLSFVAGRIVMRSGAQFAVGLLTLLSIIALYGTGLIWLKSFTPYASLLLAWILPAAGFYWYDHARHVKPTLRLILLEYFKKIDISREPKYLTVIAAAYGACTLACVALLVMGQTETSIQSPWQTVHPLFFFLYTAASALLIYFALNSQRTALSLILTSVHFLISSSVALIVYTLGYGYDPFIHRATELIIAQTGGINPTPLYYLGQYSLVIFLQQLSGLPLDIVDRVLTPLLFALIIPTIIYQAFSQWISKQYSLVLAIATLALPFGGFIMTVPQNLANIWFIATIAGAMLYFKNKISVWLLYGLALTTLAIHPLAGIPLFATVMLIHVFQKFHSTCIRYPFIYLGSGALFSLALPAALLASTAILSWPQKSLMKALISYPQWSSKADLMLDLVYLWARNGIFIIALLAIAGAWYLRRHKTLHNYLPFIAASIMLIGGYLITYFFLSFPALSDHDQPDFIKRLLTLALYAAGPIILIGVYKIVETLWEHDRATKIALVVLGSGLLTISLYLSYPRLNQYEPSKFFSVSHSDISAVEIIEQTAHPEHIVLANQMIGAVAIQQVGFKKYYTGEFFYSLPSGTPHQLHDYYLEMIYGGARRDTMEKAMAYAGVSEGYFVINRYWNNAERIANQARQNADEVTSVDNGNLYIFKYRAQP